MPPLSDFVHSPMHIDDHPKVNSQESQLEKHVALPKKLNGDPYRYRDLTPEQAIIALAVWDAVWKFLTHHKDYKSLRGTVMGSAGTGKSFLINTIVTMIRTLTGMNETIFVTAPSGAAACNVGGSTLHSFAIIKVRAEWHSLTKEDKVKLRNRLRHLLVLIIDERSMMNPLTTGAAEKHVRQSVYNEKGDGHDWGGIPVVLVIGDDYQLPPVGERVIAAYANIASDKPRNETLRCAENQLMSNAGMFQLTDVLTNSVFKLTRNQRQTNQGSGQPNSIFTPERHLELLENIRLGKPTKEDADILMSLHVNEIDNSDGFLDRLYINPKSQFLYATNAPRNEKNMEMLHLVSTLNKEKVAMFTSRYTSTMKHKDYSIAYRSHFDQTGIVNVNNICVGAKVAVSTVNFKPTWGLYNGVMGWVRDIVYKRPQGPNNEIDCIPEYVVVEIPEFSPPSYIPPWDASNPKVRF